MSDEEFWELVWEYKRKNAVRIIHHQEQQEAAIKEATSKVPKDKRSEFLEFLQTGECRPSFLEWLNGNDEALKLCDMVIDSDGIMKDIFGPNGFYKPPADDEEEEGEYPSW